MKTENKIIILLLLLPPIFGELLSGASPPLQFFSLGLPIMILLYGCGALLIREARVRWKMQWSIIFLLIAYGIIEEGLLVKSFFNPGWHATALTSGYAMYFGVQWIWTLMIISFHATLSLMLPITIIDYYWPKYRNVSLIKRKGITLSIIGIVAVTVLGFLVFGDYPTGTLVDGKLVPFFPHNAQTISWTIITFALIYLGYYYRNSQVVKSSNVYSPALFGFLGFLYQFCNGILFYVILPKTVSGGVAILIFIIVQVLFLMFVFYQILNKNITKRHITSLVLWSAMFWILGSFLNEFANGKLGMSVVGIVVFVLLLLWRRRVLKGN